MSARQHPLEELAKWHDHQAVHLCSDSHRIFARTLRAAIPDCECGELVRANLSADHAVMFSHREGEKLVVAAKSHFGTRWDWLGTAPTPLAAVMAAYAKAVTV